MRPPPVNGRYHGSVRWLCAVLLITACDDERPIPPAFDLSVAMDLTADQAEPPDLLPPPDMVSLLGVICGSARCASDADQFCDSADYGKSGTCRAHTTATSTPYGCDGPEDCPTGVCCLIPEGSACSSVGFCLTGRAVKGRWMCHIDMTCGIGWSCCPLAPDAPYAACFESNCP